MTTSDGGIRKAIWNEYQASVGLDPGARYFGTSPEINNLNFRPPDVVDSALDPNSPSPAKRSPLPSPIRGRLRELGANLVSAPNRQVLDFAFGGQEP